MRRTTAPNAMADAKHNKPANISSPMWGCPTGEHQGTVSRYRTCRPNHDDAPPAKRRREPWFLGLDRLVWCAKHSTVGLRSSCEAYTLTSGPTGIAPQKVQAR
jgi:hypothetical protein